jgi:drug/metabolite transporter (DMT)-like permease
MAAAAMTISAVAMAPFAAVTGFPIPDPVIAIWLIILAVAATAGALVLFYALIRSDGAIRANLADYLAPAFGVACGRAFLSEPIHSQALAGLALILIGSYLAAT